MTTAKGNRTATWRNTPFAHAFYHSKAWKKVRKTVWDRAHGLCEECYRRGEVKPADVVHHRIPLSPENMSDPSISLNPDRLVALCHECHTEEHKKLGIGAMSSAKIEEQRVGFDPNGNVIRL